MSKAYVFDVYGTLVSEEAVDRAADEIFPGRGLGKVWRKKKTEYFLLRQILGRYRSLYHVAIDALRYAAKAVHVQLTPEAEMWLMQAYMRIPAFSDSAFLLNELKKAGRQTIAISNGSENMLHQVLRNSQLDLFLDVIISVDECKQYKPSAAAYHLVLDHVKLRREEVLFVSAHGWDIAGAKNFGFHTAWINRKNQPQDELQLKPDYEYTRLSSVLNKVGDSPPPL